MGGDHLGDRVHREVRERLLGSGWGASLWNVKATNRQRSLTHISMTLGITRVTIALNRFPRFRRERLSLSLSDMHKT